jgi:hypothetical protein
VVVNKLSLLVSDNKSSNAPISNVFIVATMLFVMLSVRMSCSNILLKVSYYMQSLDL